MWYTHRLAQTSVSQFTGSLKEYYVGKEKRSSNSWQLFSDIWRRGLWACSHYDVSPVTANTAVISASKKLLVLDSISTKQLHWAAEGSYVQGQLHYSVHTLSVAVHIRNTAQSRRGEWNMASPATLLSEVTDWLHVTSAKWIFTLDMKFQFHFIAK